MNRPQFPTLAHSEADVHKTLVAAQAIREEFDNTEYEQVVEQMKDKLPHILFKNR